MIGLKEQVFGDLGYSADLKLNPEELQVFRECINDQWLNVICKYYPEFSKEAKALGIQNHHKLSDAIDHKKLWPKSNRVLPQASVQKIKDLPFMDKLRQEFGNCSISDIYDTEQHHGEEEIYWRLVRPNVATDVGPLHCDQWFHAALNDGKGMFATRAQTVKIWVPIFCEPGKSGLAIVPGSHLKEWNYHMVTDGDVPRPVFDEQESTVEAKLMVTEPGNMLIFNEDVLHGGVVNKGNYTRVSAEITLVFE